MRATNPRDYGPDLDFDTPSTHSVYAQPTPSGAQIDLLRRLRREWQEAEDTAARFAGRPAVYPRWQDPASKEEASAAISRGVDAVKAKRDERDRELIEGAYTDGERIWLVKIGHESRKPYAKIWNGVDGFVYDRDALAEVCRVAHRASHEEAAAFGVRFGFCCGCGKFLHKPRSVEVGYGEKCAENNGWPY